MEFIAPYVALVIATALPTNMQMAAGVLVLAAVSWREKTPSATQTIVLAWIAWTAQRTYVPMIVEDGLYVSDTTLLMLGAVFFGLGAHRTFDASLYPLCAFITCVMAALPIRPTKGTIGSVWSAAMYSACVGGMMWVDQTTETPWHLRALCCIWILFVRNDPVYVASAACFAMYVATRIYNKTQIKSEAKGATSNPAVLQASIASKTPTAAISRRTPKPFMTQTLPFQQSTRPDEIDPEAASVAPFALGRN